MSLARKFHGPLLQSETKISKQKRFRKKLVQSQREKKMGHLEIEHGVIILNYINAKLLN